MSIQMETLQASGICARGFHDCQVRWQCPHGLTFDRHTSAGKFQTANEGAEQGARPCPECTVKARAAEARLSDTVLMATLNKALGLVPEERQALAQGWLQITDGRPILEAKGLVTSGPEAR